MILYHYCNVDAFFNILKNKKIWLSGLNNLNDYKEITWTNNKIFEILGSLDEEYAVDDVALIWDNLKTGNSLPFIFSLSSNGDLLSQWRAYARDGSGVSIGFNPRYFPKTKHLPHTNAAASENLTLFDVVYNEHQQNDFLRKTIIETLKAMKAKTEAEKARVVADATYALRGCSLFFKNPAFSEEAEWRLIHTPLIMGDKDNNTKIYGNISEIKQRVTNNRIYSYFEFDFSRNSNEKPILEIILGPKCEINDFDMSLFLSLNGFPDVKLKKSSASYR